jgi:hypothetical protein
MYEYGKQDIKDCLHDKRLVFVGDSTTRQVFWAVARKLDNGRAQNDMTKMLEGDEKHRDLEFEVDGVKAQFIWDPYLNSTALYDELKAFEPGSRPKGQTDEKEESKDSASLLLLGAPGLWYARHGDENSYKPFKETVDAIIPYMDHRPAAEATAGRGTFSSRQGTANLLLMTPVHEPWYESLSPSREETMTPEKIDKMNEYLRQVSTFQDADIVWSYEGMIKDEKRAYAESGIHVIDNVASRKADVLLNLRCNADAAERGYPYNRTCCSNYRKPDWVQWSVILSGLGVLPLMLLARRKHLMRVRLPDLDLLKAITIFFLVICLCFYADRTQVFEKSQKEFRSNEFLGACALAAVLGLVTIRKNGPQTGVGKGSKHTLCLPREQTDEWKGWMQCVVLIYHYTWGSKVVPIYKVVRLLVASYLFLSAWGHTVYFLRTSDYSLRRVASVLARLNLLTVSLAYMMRTDYQFYYFAPLVSFWFLVIYATLRCKAHENNHFGHLVLKIFISAILVMTLIHTPGILESIFRLLRLLGITWDVAEFRFRVVLDLYIPYLGILLASISHHASLSSYFRLVDNSKRKPLEVFSLLVSLIILAAFWTAVSTLDKYEYNSWHPLISFLPILAFLVLRNCSSALRSYHSAAFASLGRISLETFVLQYHIWLAADSKGLLSIGLWGRYTEFILLSPIFLWVAWGTERATATIAGRFVGQKATHVDVDDGNTNGKWETVLLPTREGHSKDSLCPSSWTSSSWIRRISRMIRKSVAGTQSRRGLAWRFMATLGCLWVVNCFY